MQLLLVRATCAFLACISVGSAGCSATKHEGTSVVLITIDTLRSDALGSYGSGRTDTPHLDALADAGVLFENAISQAPATGPSFTSMMTSLYPAEHGVVHSTLVIDPGNDMLAERFREAGYRTGAFVSCSILQKAYGFGQGFQVYDDETSQPYSPSHFERDAAETTSRALAWLDGNREQKFFLWVHYFDGHAPYQERRPPGAKWNAEEKRRARRGSMGFLSQIQKKRSQEMLDANLPTIRELYAAEVRHVDQQVGHLLERIDAIRCRDRTLVVVGSDHGEELFDHGFFHGHYSSLSQSVLRVPLLFSLPGRLPEGLRVDAVVQNVDIAPTILAIAGLPPFTRQSGVDLMPVMGGAAFAEGRLAWSMREPYESMPGGNAVAVRDQRWKAIFYSKDDPHLYDLESDAMERQNLAEEDPERLEAFRDRLGEWLGEDGPSTYRHSDLSESDYELLKSLGYIQ
jgi:arylsulfatase A-like enzyme